MVVLLALIGGLIGIAIAAFYSFTPEDEEND